MFEGIKEALQPIIDKIRNAFGIEKKEKEVERVKPGEVEDINEKLDRAKSNAEADAAMWKQKYKKLKNAVEEREKVNIGKELQKEKEQLNNKMFEGAVSIKKLMEYLDKKKVSGVSKQGGTEFGKIKDIWVLNNGQMAPVVNKNGSKQPIMTGKTWKDLFRNFKNLQKSVVKGLAFLNLDDDGNFSPNIEAEKVPNIIMDAEGNFVTTQAHTEEVQKLLAQKERTINKLHKQIKTSDEAWLQEHEDLREMEDWASLTKKRTDSMKSSVKDELAATKDIMQDDRLKSRAMADMMNSMEMSEKVEDRFKEKRDELVSKFTEMFPKTARELEEGKIKKYLSYVQSHMVEPLAVKEVVEEREKEEEESEGGTTF